MNAIQNPWNEPVDPCAPRHMVAEELQVTEAEKEPFVTWRKAGAFWLGGTIVLAIARACGLSF